MTSTPFNNTETVKLKTFLTISALLASLGSKYFRMKTFPHCLKLERGMLVFGCHLLYYNCYDKQRTLKGHSQLWDCADLDNIFVT